MTIDVAARKCADFKRATWQLTSGHYVSLEPTETKFGTSLKQCKEHCLKETSFSCKSFDRKVGDNNCYLFSKARRDLKSSEFKKSEDANHYEWICKGTPLTRFFSALEIRRGLWQDMMVAGMLCIAIPTFALNFVRPKSRI